MTIPPARNGRGQVQIIVSGRLTTVVAETAHQDPLKPGQSVRIIDRIGDSDFPGRVPLINPIVQILNQPESSRPASWNHTGTTSNWESLRGGK